MRISLDVSESLHPLTPRIIRLIWNESNVSADDYLHEADPAVEKYLDRQIGFSFSRMLDSVRTTPGRVVLIHTD